MHDPLEAARARAENARKAHDRLKEEIDRTFRELATGVYTEPQRAALEDLIKVERLRLQQAHRNAELYADIAKGKRVLE